MKLTKNLRSPSLSLFLASLVMFVSCSQYDHETEFEPLDLSGYIEKHLELTSELSALIEKERTAVLKQFFLLLTP